MPVELGKPVNVVADTGYFSAANVSACVEQKITPLIAVKRDPHDPFQLFQIISKARKQVTEGSTI